MIIMTNLVIRLSREVIEHFKSEGKGWQTRIDVALRQHIVKHKDNMKTYDWDPADDIKTKEDVIGILEAAIEENDPRFLLSVIGDIARSKGMTQYEVNR